jgi:hypothetical protein
MYKASETYIVSVVRKIIVEEERNNKNSEVKYPSPHFHGIEVEQSSI